MIDLNTILLAVISLAATYFGIKQKGQNALALAQVEKTDQQEKSKVEHTAALSAHTTTMNEVVRVIQAQNISNHVVSEQVNQLISAQGNASESNSELRKEVHKQIETVKEFTPEVKRGMEEIHRRIDGALERRNATG